MTSDTVRRPGRLRALLIATATALAAVVLGTTGAGGTSGSASTTRVSVAAGGIEGNDRSLATDISFDGRYVVFGSEASNLVGDDTNGIPDIFVHDRKTTETSRVSVASGGTEADGSGSWTGVISQDGRYVAFTSPATNLVAGDTNGVSDVFVHDRQTATTTRVSVATDGTQADGWSYGASMSGDGRHVTFASAASNLVAGDTNSVSDVFVHDRQTATTTRVSVATDGTQGDDSSHAPSISDDAGRVVFTSDATNLAAGDTNGASDIFLRDLETGETARVSVASDGTQGDDDSTEPFVSGDGRHVVFSSSSSNLVTGDTNNLTDVFARDLETDKTARVSVASDGTQGSDESFASMSSGDGRLVTFSSYATNLVSDDTNGTYDVFVHDRKTATTTRASVASDGAEAGGRSSEASISGDGRFVAFSSDATNLVTGDTNGVSDIFVRDRGDGTAFPDKYEAYPGFAGGAFVAAGDVDGDGRDEIVTGADAGGGPHVRVFKEDTARVSDFLAYGGFAGGVRVAAGDVDGDTRDEIITAAGPGGGPHVAIWDGDGSLVCGFMAYGDFQGGVYVAAGDVDGDTKDEIITGAGPGGGPHVAIWDGDCRREHDGFMAYGGFAGGVRVAAGDVDGDTKDEIITAAGPGGGPHVRVLDLAGRSSADFFAYSPAFRGGVYVAVDEKSKSIVTGAGEGGGPHVRTLAPDGTARTDMLFVTSPQVRGVRVAAGAFSTSEPDAGLLLTGGSQSRTFVSLRSADGGQLGGSLP